PDFSKVLTHQTDSRFLLRRQRIALLIQAGKSFFHCLDFLQPFVPAAFQLGRRQTIPGIHCVVCSNAFLASYSSCSRLLDRAARCAASPAFNSSMALRLASTPKREITFKTSSLSLRSTKAPPKPMQYCPPSS